MVQRESGFAKLVLHKICTAEVVLCEKGFKENWFNDSIDE